jgi:hypothetical protein
MLLKYSLSTQITNNTETDVKWILPATITLATSNTYAFTSVDITKGTPFIINPLQIGRFTLSINNQQELITKTYAVDYGVNSTGYTNISKISSIKITNPTGTRGPIGNQFSNPNIIDVKYLLVLEKITT